TVIKEKKGSFTNKYKSCIIKNKNLSPVYVSGWGLSLLIGESILFDAGQRGIYFYITYVR
ncbi:MAG: hypothetical protein JXA79_09025, partial [Deltaproteobacteria bacterium]|nr:hypothetical protein [Deltaproteobacteria bacterium]